MTNDQALDSAVRALLREPAVTRTGGLHRALARVGTTPQRRRRWWPFAVTNTGPRARGVSMASAVKFVVAAVIVALFGGFLLAGVLTAPPGDEMAPATTNDTILPGVTLNVEEVEPGVFRVIDDGERDIAKANNTGIVAGHDGGIWLLRPQHFFRLGSEAHEWPVRKLGVPDFEVAPDGTVWAMSGGHLYSVGRGSDDWTRTKGPAGGFSGQFEGSAFWVTSDGTVWATWEGVVGYLGADGWQPVGERPKRPHSQFHDLFVSDRGDIWAFTGDLEHLVDGAWRTYGSPDGGWSVGKAAGADGTFWGTGRWDFVRFDGTEWTTFAWPDWVPDGRGTTDPLRAARDGSIWVGTPGHRYPGSVCSGVGHFDGMSWSRYLPDLCVEAMDITADGVAWVLASRDDTDDSLPRHVYVITPEAVAATE